MIIILSFLAMQPVSLATGTEAAVKTVEECLRICVVKPVGSTWCFPTVPIDFKCQKTPKTHPDSFWGGSHSLRSLQENKLFLKHQLLNRQSEEQYPSAKAINTGLGCCFWCWRVRDSAAHLGLSDCLHAFIWASFSLSGYLCKMSGLRYEVQRNF